MSSAIRCLIYLALLSLCVSEPTLEPQPEDPQSESEEPPEGYYAFVESPNATPPRVRPPPYQQVSSECAAVGDRAHVSANNLCGDLNRGVIPRNPMGQSPNGEPYPFDLIRNHTLRFLSRTLPVLRADDALPRVAHVHQHAGPLVGPHAGPHVGPHAGPHVGPHVGPQVGHEHVPDVSHNSLEERVRRSLSAEVPSSALRPEHRALDSPIDSDDTPRESRKFCDGGGVFCMLYRAINGDSAGPERREDPGIIPHSSHPAPHKYEGPPTPCPARVEYATPVFARNYQGVFRYVVQIPYEGYFTQTVEVTRCMQSRCHYLEGGCLSSPRWLSLLVAELHYPPAGDTQEYNQFPPKHESESSTEKPQHCDGHDALGCYQVRLYYDWFLVPGSCKCWRPDYFARYVRRNRHEL